MPIDEKRLLALPIPDVTQHYTADDAILYALALGLGGDPLDERALRFVLEDRLVALPTFAVVLASPGFWMRDLDTGVDWVHLVHGEQRLTMHRPLAPAGCVTGRTRVTAAIDKGPGRGAIVESERLLVGADGVPIATLVQSAVCRNDGGFGGSVRTSPAPYAVPERAPDGCADRSTPRGAALLYRLCGDRNPLHADPAVARAAGFERPILHGLATYGIAGSVLLDALAGGEPARLRALDARFTAPVFPGDTLRVEWWRDAHTVPFRVRALERDVVVLGNGRAVIV